MIKTILVALDGSEHADAALRYALWLAERVRATVLGLHVIDVVSIGLLGSTTESVTRKSPKPVFVSPMRFKEIGRPLLAYDGSQRASAAMHAAAEVTSALSLPLTVIHVGREEAADGTRVLDEARRYLHSYGLALSCETITGYPHQRIVEFIRERGHDLLFIGAY